MLHDRQYGHELTLFNKIMSSPIDDYLAADIINEEDEEEGWYNGSE